MQIAQIAIQPTVSPPNLGRLSRVLRYPFWDSLFIGLALAHGLVILIAGSLPLIAIGLWWNANTIAHNFIHLPFFKREWLNNLFSAYLSLVLGIPQRLWRDRHLAHHAAKPWRCRVSAQLVFESLLVLALWSGMAWLTPTFFWSVYLPGWAAGLGLCQLQGFYEHARGTTSYYGKLYNFLFFNDGYHAEHHTHPAAHWTRLPKIQTAPACHSRWPAVLRWLNSLERLVLRSKRLQNFVIARHEPAFRELLAHRTAILQVGIVGGGLFPRSALICKKLLPHAHLILIDTNADHLEIAYRFLHESVEYRHQLYLPSDDSNLDLLIVPLAFIGSRRRLYEAPPAPLLLVHDWIWRPKGESTVVSWTLLKRLNLIAAGQR